MQTQPITADMLEILVLEAVQRRLGGLDHELSKLLDLEVTDSSGATKINPEEVIDARLAEIATMVARDQLKAAKNFARSGA